MRKASSEAMQETRGPLASTKVLVFSVLHDGLTEESQDMQYLGGSRSHLLRQVVDNVAVRMRAISAASRLRPH